MATHNPDNWLNRVLAEYGKAEPRHGLEQRVLENLAGEQARVAAPRWWGALAAVAVVIAFLAVWIGNRSMRNSQTLLTDAHSQASSATTPTPRPIENQSYRGLLKRSEEKHPHPEKTQALIRVQQREEARPPKLDQFPSTRPLSSQEKLLIAYVQQTPNREIMAVEKQAYELSDLQIKDLEIPALVENKEPRGPK